MNKPEKNDDSDYEEEESLVVVELTGIMEADLLPKVQECKVLGIDTDKPLLQLDHYAFQGEYEDAMGTCLLFEEKSIPNSDGSGDKPREKELEFKHLTSRKLCMQRVFINKKNTQNGETLPTEEGESTSEQIEVDVGTSMSTAISETAYTQPGTSSDNTASQPGTGIDEVDSAGTSSQTLSQSSSESDIVTFSSGSGTIPQTGSDSLQNTSVQLSTSLVDHSRTEQDANNSSASKSERQLSEARPFETGLDNQSFTIEVYTGMETEDSDVTSGTETNPNVLDTGTRENKVNKEKTCSDEPNG